MVISVKQITSIAAVIVAIGVIWAFGEKLIGPEGFIVTSSIRADIQGKHDTQLYLINEVGLDIKRLRLEINKKEISYSVRRCGIEPLEGNCLNPTEKIYYAGLLETKKELKEAIK